MSNETEPRSAIRALLSGLRLTMALAMLALVPIMLLPPGWFGMDDMSPQQLQVALSGNHPPQVIDVRTDVEYASGHIDGAVPWPVHRLLFQVSALGGDTDRDMVLICLSGHRSRLAGLALRMAGYQHVINLTGGMHAWKKARLPINQSLDS